MKNIKKKHFKPIEKNFYIRGEDYQKARNSKEIPQLTPKYLKLKK